METTNQIGQLGYLFTKESANTLLRQMKSGELIDAIVKALNQIYDSIVQADKDGINVTEAYSAYKYLTINPLLKGRVKSFINPDTKLCVLVNLDKDEEDELSRSLREASQQCVKLSTKMHKLCTSIHSLKLNKRQPEILLPLASPGSLEPGEVKKEGFW